MGDLNRERNIAIQFNVTSIKQMFNRFPIEIGFINRENYCNAYDYTHTKQKRCSKAYIFEIKSEHAAVILVGLFNILPFHDLYVYGININAKNSVIFSLTT